MTKRFFIGILCGAALVASCQKTELQGLGQDLTDVPAMDFMFRTVTEEGMTQTPETKLNIARDLKTNWEENDTLAVYDGRQLRQFFVYEIDQTNQSEASFCGKVAEGATQYHALYPYSAVESFTDGKFIATIPAVQTAAGVEMADPRALLAVAEVSGGDKLAFKNVCGLLKVNVPDAGINQIVIEGAKGEALAGRGTITVGDAPVFTPMDDASKTVTILPPGGEGSSFAAGNYYAAVAPVLFEEGFKITLVRLDEKSGVTSTDQCLEVVRNGGLYLTDAVTSYEWKWVIMTKEQLLAWNNSNDAGSAASQFTWYSNDYVELGADIDMDGEVWIPNVLYGTFDGKGHKIYNLVVDTKQEGHPAQKYASFITYCFGTLKNVVIGSKDGETYDGKSIFLHDPQANDASWAYVGVVGKVSGGKNKDNESVIGHVANVKNFAKLQIASGDSKIKFAVGGIAAMVETTGATIKESYNYGDISVLNEGDPQATTCVIGGITGKFDREGSIINCENHGNIINSHRGVHGIGGIVGNTNARPENITPLIKGTDNYGIITLNNSVTDIFAGGIVGRFSGAIIEDCENNGAFNMVSSDVKLYYGGIAGRFVNDFKNADGNFILKKESKIINCKNNSTALFNYKGNPTVAGNDLRIAGMFNTEGGGTAALTLSGCYNYASYTITHPRIRCLGGIVGGAAAKTMPVTITDCHNYGTFTIAPNGEYGTAVNYAGIAALLYGNGASNTVVTGCTNNAPIIDKMRSTGGHYVGGIVGNLQNGVAVVSCENNAKLEIEQSSGNVLFGGIAGNFQHASRIEECVNNGEIISTYDNVGKKATAQIGGVVGSGGATTGSVYKCVNNAPVMVTHHTSDGFNVVGGIVGRAADLTIEECLNNATATVTSSVTSTNQLTAVGGVLGEPNGKVVVKNNVNYASVTGSNVKGYMYAGGIFGSDCEENLHVANKGAKSVTGNRNYGSVSASSTASPSNNSKYYTANTVNGVAAGGLYGILAQSTGVESDNYNYGNVTATAADSPSNAGAAAGVSNPASDWGCYIGKGVSVNSVLWSESVDAAWVSPLNTRTITATYVDQPTL